MASTIIAFMEIYDYILFTNMKSFIDINLLKWEKDG